MGSVTYINPPNYWSSNHTLGSSETPSSGDITLYDRAINTSNKKESICIDATAGALKWAIYDVALYSGTATLVLGVATISLTSLASNQRIRLDYVTPGGTTGAIFVFSINPGTGFVINSTSSLDTSTIAWSVYSA